MTQRMAVTSRAERSRIERQAKRLYRWAAAVAVLAIGVGAFLLWPRAEPTHPGLWYYDLVNMDAIHEQGITGAGVTIAVIDNPVNLEVPTLADAIVEPQPSPCLDESGQPIGPSTSTDVELAGHGTEMVSLLVGTGLGYEGQIGVKGLAPGARILTYPDNFQMWPDENTVAQCPGSQSAALAEAKTPPTTIALSIVAAVDAGADIISCSFHVASDNALAHAVAYALRHGVIIVAGVPNEDFDASTNPGTGAPHGLNGVLSVNLGDRDGNIPQYRETTDVVAPGVNILQQGFNDDWTVQAVASGTSHATAFVTGTVALALQAHPEATSNQILQSVLHNTGFEEHPLTYGHDFAYGIVVPSRLVEVNPTQYDDNNPLLANYRDVLPWVSAIWPDNPYPTETAPESRPYPAFTPLPGTTEASAATP